MQQSQQIANELQRRYDIDHASRRIARAESDIPICFELITPEWFTAVLCQTFPGVHVTAFRLSAEDDGSTNRRRIFLEYDADVALPRVIFAKATHALQNRLLGRIFGGVDAEHGFYRLLRPVLAV